MRLPSTKMMVNRGFTLEEAKKIRTIMEGYHYGIGRKILEEISEVMGGFGCEFIERGSNQKSPPIHYVNMGDTYDTTVMLINSRFVIGCWGSIVERGNYA